MALDWAVNSAQHAAKHAEEIAAWEKYRAIAKPSVGIDGDAEDETWAAGRAGHDKVLADFIEEVVQLLLRMQTPGSKFLSLTE